MPGPRKAHRPLIPACILAGGLSSRFGRDKALVRVGGRTMLAHVRAAANAAGLSAQVLRHDDVARCGPIGGIITALRRTRADALVFLACDMPFVTADLLSRVVKASARATRPVFCVAHGRAGFPCLLPRTVLGIAEDQHARGEFSVRALAARINAAHVRVRAADVLNINTPDDLANAERLLAQRPRT